MKQFKMKDQKIKIDVKSPTSLSLYINYYLNGNHIFEVAGYQWNLINAEEHYKNIFLQDIKRVIKMINKNNNHSFHKYSREYKIKKALI